MKFSLFNDSQTQNIIELFKDVFSASEGEAEGQVICDFVENLIAKTKLR